MKILSKNVCCLLRALSKARVKFWPGNNLEHFRLNPDCFVCVCARSDDLWVREGKILDPEKLFFDEQAYADNQVDCGGAIVAPGFIDVQINGGICESSCCYSSMCVWLTAAVCAHPAGGYGVDFSQASDDIGAGISLVAQRLLEHGVTSFCPTLVTSPPHVYHKVMTTPTITMGGVNQLDIIMTPDPLCLSGPTSDQSAGRRPPRRRRPR